MNIQCQSTTDGHVLDTKTQNISTSAILNINLIPVVSLYDVLGKIFKWTNYSKQYGYLEKYVPLLKQLKDPKHLYSFTKKKTPGVNAVTLIDVISSIHEYYSTKSKRKDDITKNQLLVQFIVSGDAKRLIEQQMDNNAEAIQKLDFLINHIQSTKRKRDEDTSHEPQQKKQKTEKPMVIIRLVDDCMDPWITPPPQITDNPNNWVPLEYDHSIHGYDYTYFLKTKWTKLVKQNKTRGINNPVTYWTQMPGYLPGRKANHRTFFGCAVMEWFKEHAIKEDLPYKLKDGDIEMVELFTKDTITGKIRRLYPFMPPVIDGDFEQ
jgi:hypothetical protein